MRTFISLVVLTILLCTCNGRQTSSEPEYRPAASVREIMSSIIDPSADGVWDSVKTMIDAAGTHETLPQTDEEWAAVRRHAITLLEAANLLLVPGRRIAPPGATVEDPRFQNPPEVVEAKVSQDREGWIRMTHDLQLAAAAALKAVDAKNGQGVFDAGGVIYQACEKCHNKYWIPAGVNPPER